MKTAVTSSGQNLQSQVDPRFGRAACFVVVDTDSGKFEAFDNAQKLNAVQGAGVQAAENVARLGVQAVITGHCGPNAHRTLSAAGIEIFLGADGTVSEMVEKFRKGELLPSDSPDKQGHWM